MIFYASGTFVDPLRQQTVVDHSIAILTSFAYKQALWQQMPTLATRLRAANKRIHFMLDSGAFTAWSLGKTIRLEALIDGANKIADAYGDCIDLTVVALDRVPGKRGVKPTAADYRQAAEESVQNYDIMRERVSAYVKPVFHLGDPEWLADHYDRHADYISLAASRDLAYEQRRKGAADMSRRWTDKKLHGLAMTGTRMLRTVPWHSVDSAAWVQWAGFGNMAWVMPNGSLKTIQVSRESPRNKDHDQHITTMAGVYRDVIMAGVRELGFTFEQIQSEFEVRASVSIVMFNRACDFASRAGVHDENTGGLFDADS